MFIDKCPLCGFDLIFVDMFGCSFGFNGFDDSLICSNVDLKDHWEAVLNTHYELRFWSKKFYSENFFVCNGIQVISSFSEYKVGKISRVIFGDKYIDLDQYISPYNLDKVKLYAMLF